MSFGVKTNERPGTRAQVRYVRMSAYKAREVLDLIRGKELQQADEILQFCERDAAIVVRKCLASAAANAEHNNEIESEELYVSACFADEGPTLKRWRPRARGRATRIRKRTCHITVIVSRLSPEQLERRQQRESTSAAAAGRGRRRSQAAAEARRARVAKSRAREETPEVHDHEHDDEAVTDETDLDVDETSETQAGVDETVETAEEPETEATAETVTDETDATEEDAVSDETSATAADATEEEDE
jgi:large subunit ribosomal protein L22